MRYYFGVTRPERFTAAHGAVVAQAIVSYGRLTVALDSLVSEISPVGRALAPGEEEALCRFCFVLALYEECYRAGVHGNSPLMRVGRDPKVEALLSLAAEPVVADLSARSVAFFASQGPLVARRGDAVLNPTFKGSGLAGGADAHLVVRGCLIDVKTSKQSWLAREAAYQLIGYPLLNFDGRYGITAVGFYRARVPGVVTWPLADLVDEAGDQARRSRIFGQI